MLHGHQRAAIRPSHTKRGDLSVTAGDPINQSGGTQQVEHLKLARLRGLRVHDEGGLRSVLTVLKSMDGTAGTSE